MMPNVSGTMYRIAVLGVAEISAINHPSRGVLKNCDNIANAMAEHSFLVFLNTAHAPSSW